MSLNIRTLKYFDLLMDKELVNVCEVLETWRAVSRGISRSCHPLNLRPLQAMINIQYI